MLNFEQFTIKIFYIADAFTAYYFRENLAQKEFFSTIKKFVFFKALKS